MNNEFYIKLSATVDGLVNGLKKASDSVKDVSKDIADTGKSITDSAKSFDAFERGGAVFEKLNDITGGYAEEVVNLGKRLWSAMSLGVEGAQLLKVALISTGIGALVVAVGLLIAYWQEIKGWVVGVSRELKDQRGLIEDQLEDQEYIVSLQNASDNILKLQGKSQTEINNLKIKELETLLEIKLQLIDNLKTSLESAQKQEKFYRDLATKLIIYAVAPVVALAKALDSVLGTNTADEITRLARSFRDLITPDLTSELSEELDKITLSARKTEDAIAGLKLKNIAIELAKVKRAMAPEAESFLKPETMEERFGTQGAVELVTFKEVKIPKFATQLSEEFLLMQIAINDFNDSANDLIVNSIGATFGQLGSAIGEALATGGNVLQAIGTTVLQALGGFLSDMGGMLIKYGTLAVLKGKLDLAILSGGPVSIGAGIAAIAVGIALKAAGSAIGTFANGGGKGGGGASSSSGGGSGSGGGARYGSSSGGFSGGRVVFEIAGTKLVGVLSNTLKENASLSGNISVTG